MGTKLLRTYSHWDTQCTVFLTPIDTLKTKQGISEYRFGAELRDSLRALLDPQAPVETVSVDRVRRTATGLFKVQLPAHAVQAALHAGSLGVGQFGEWRVEGMRASAAPSLVIMGVDCELSDEQVANSLMLGSRHLLQEADRGRLGELRARRMFRSLGHGSEGDGQMHTSCPTRNVRVYCPPDLLDKFETMGFMRLDWTEVRCRPYIPRQFYCKTCGKMGSHGTTFHRSAIREL